MDRHCKHSQSSTPIVHTKPLNQHVNHVCFIQYRTTIQEIICEFKSESLGARLVCVLTCMCWIPNKTKLWVSVNAYQQHSKSVMPCHYVYAVDFNHLLIWEIESGSLWARPVCVMTCIRSIPITCSSEKGKPLTTVTQRTRHNTQWSTKCSCTRIRLRHKLSRQRGKFY